MSQEHTTHRSEAAGHHGVAHTVGAAARTSLRTLRRGASAVARRMPGTVRASRAGVSWTVESLQTLPDATLRSIAATSIGLGAGLSFTRAGRFAALVGVVPAALVEAAIAVRPSRPARRGPVPE